MRIIRHDMLLMLDLIRAVGHLHSNGYLHGDIKPSNCLIFDCNRLKLANFGGACTFEEAKKNTAVM
jgi:serine/threonine protein kinase